MYENIKEDVIVKTLFGCDISEVNRNVIISPIWSLNSFVEKADNVKKSFKGWYRGITITYKGVDVTVINSCIGAPLTGDCVIALGYTPCENILFSGSAGGINESYGFGDLIVCDNAIIGEGFSRYHWDNLLKDCFGEVAAGSKQIAEVLFNKTKEIATKSNLNTHRGRIFTTDSILGENEESFGYMMNKDCDAVEMELSAVFTASKKIGRKAAGLITISDLPLRTKSLFDGVREEDAMNYNNSVSIIPEILLETVLKL